MTHIILDYLLHGVIGSLAVFAALYIFYGLGWFILEDEQKSGVKQVHFSDRIGYGFVLFLLSALFIVIIVAVGYGVEDLFKMIG